MRSSIEQARERLVEALAKARFPGTVEDPLGVLGRSYMIVNPANDDCDILAGTILAIKFADKMVLCISSPTDWSGQEITGVSFDGKRWSLHTISGGRESIPQPVQFVLLQ